MDSIVVCLTVFIYCLGCQVRAAGESPQQFWEGAKAELNRAKAKYEIYSKAKNGILMIGDGLGLSTVTAGRIYKGQTKGMSGEEYRLSFETFPNVGLIKTYNSDFQVADSAGTATAMLTGFKTRKSVLGLDSMTDSSSKDCSSYDKSHELQNILDYALADGKSVGIVTTTRLTHATPAAAYSHVFNRYMENPAQLKKSFTNCDDFKDIARQLIEDNPDIQVIMGGGRRNFLNKTTVDPALNSVHSLQRDGPSLEQVWIDDKKARNKRHAYVDNKGKLDAINPETTDYLLGIFASSHMSYELQRDKSPSGQPSLTEMTTKAIQILRKNPKGYFLLVEGGRIDHGHHDNLAKLALGETAEFDNMVQAAQTLTNEKDTLTVVTADHSHVFNIAGYPSRGNDILGLVDFYPEGEEPNDGLPYLTLAYANGPEAGRSNLTNVDTRRNDFQVPSCIKMPWETHGGEDVGVYARGPMSHLFHTTHEQHYIAHVMMYASCLGEYASQESCDLVERLAKQQRLDNPDTCGAGTLWPSFVSLLICLLYRLV